MTGERQRPHGWRYYVGGLLVTTALICIVGGVLISFGWPRMDVLFVGLCVAALVIGGMLLSADENRTR